MRGAGRPAGTTRVPGCDPAGGLLRANSSLRLRLFAWAFSWLLFGLFKDFGAMAARIGSSEGTSERCVRGRRRELHAELGGVESIGVILNEMVRGDTATTPL